MKISFFFEYSYSYFLQFCHFIHFSFLPVCPKIFQTFITFYTHSVSKMKKKNFLKRGGSALIEVKNLVKCYGSHTAVDHLNFTIKKGQIYGFLGPNGAGKSTTMNIITGYISYTDGSVNIDGYDILENPIEVKKKIGYLPEIPPLYLDMVVWDYLEFVYELKKIKTEDEKSHIQQVIDMVKIDNVKNRKIANLSKGYRQRVGLAGALIGEPEILILDEPTVGLDPKQIIEIRNVIKELGKEKTVI